MIRDVHRIAKSAGSILLDYFNKIESSDVEEKSKNDFVTKADKESENYIISELVKLDPGIGILAEESGQMSSENDLQWVIDPLDGTKNFIHGIPYFCISIALVKENDILLGAIYDPVHDDFFYAEKGKAAFRNDLPIQCSNNSLEKSFLSTGFPFRNKEILDNYINLFKEIFNNASNIRRCGAAALDLAYIASGNYDGFWEYGLKPWDIAAGILLARESGAVVTDFWGAEKYLDNGTIVVANKRLHEELIYIITRHFKRV